MNFSVDYIINHLTPKRTQVLQDLQLDELPVENIQAVHTDVNSRAFLDLRPSQNQQNQQKKTIRETQRRPVKSFENLKCTARRLRRRKYEEAFRNATTEVHNDIKSVKVTLQLESGKTMTFYPRQGSDEENSVLEDDNLKQQKDLKLIQSVIHIKDKYRISDEALHELHMLGASIPSKNNIVLEKKRLNSTLELYTNPSPNIDCTRRKAKDILEYVMSYSKNEKYLENDTLILRFACDGAKISKNINSVRGVFKILIPRNSLPEDVKGISMSPEDEFTLFFYIGDESRPVLENLVTETFQEMKYLQENGLELNGRLISIKWIITCDWKALSIIRGINGAQCQYFCMWCHCSKKQICDFSIPSWPIQRCPLEQVKNLSGNTFGYKEKDLCPFIPYDDMPVDDLHLRIRISQKLFNQVVTWSIDQKTEDDLCKELRRIGVSFRMWEEKGDDKLNTKVKKWSQPNGDDLRTVIHKMQLANVLSDQRDRRYVNIESLTISQLKDELSGRGLDKKGKKCVLVARLKEAIGSNTKVQKKCHSRLQVSYDLTDDEYEQDLDIDALQEIWQEFHQLMESLRVLPNSTTYKTAEIFHNDAKEWASNFRKQTFDEDVIPYIHALVYHVPQFLGKFNFLHDIGVAQVERKNFDHRQAYFGSTNRNGGKNRQNISKQILERENRMLWADVEEITRVKRPYRKKTE